MALWLDVVGECALVMSCCKCIACEVASRGVRRSGSACGRRVCVLWLLRRMLYFVEMEEVIGVRVLRVGSLFGSVLVDRADSIEKRVSESKKKPSS